MIEFNLITSDLLSFSKIKDLIFLKWDELRDNYMRLGVN
jgi:hypothetical protein